MTPTFIKRMRNKVKSGNAKAVFTIVGENFPTRATILSAPFENGSYTVVFRDNSNIAKNGAPIFEVDFKDIVRPVRYGV